MGLREDLERIIRDVPDFPKKGIVFKDITPILQNPKVFKQVTDAITARFAPEKIDAVASVESRGFLIGTPVAINLGVPFVPLRKSGKLPWDKISEEFTLEYGTATIEIHKDAIRKGQRVLITDDLLATGGTAVASAKLVEKLGGVVAGFAFIVELGFLKGAGKLSKYNIYSLINYGD